MSFSIAFLRSPNPGALTAATLRGRRVAVATDLCVRKRTGGISQKAVEGATGELSQFPPVTRPSNIHFSLMPIFRISQAAPPVSATASRILSTG